jgi:tRNA pseudouridine38-40 synthase
MRRIALQIAYDGSAFYGWQKQYMSPTVQEELENALSKIAKEPINLTGSGRTDTGVHATCQIAHFDFKINMNMQQIKLALKNKIPRSIEILKAWEVPEEFHARYSATKRTYNYILSKSISPFHRNYRGLFYRYNLDTERMKAIIPYLMGVHDFTSFCKPNPDIKNHLCDIKDISFEEYEDFWIFTISANRFLHNMVRRIVGALVSISHRKQDPAIILKWIEDMKHEQRNFFTAPAAGLYLVDIEYPKELFPYEKEKLIIF